MKLLTLQQLLEWHQAQALALRYKGIDRAKDYRNPDAENLHLDTLEFHEDAVILLKRMVSAVPA